MGFKRLPYCASAENWSSDAHTGEHWLNETICTHTSTVCIETAKPATGHAVGAGSKEEGGGDGWCS